MRFVILFTLLNLMIDLLPWEKVDIIAPLILFINLSPNKFFSHHLVFVSNLDKIQVPNFVHKALTKLEQNKSILEWIHALENNGTWELSDYPTLIKKIIQWDANGFLHLKKT